VKRLIELANKIKNKTLREKTIKLLKEQEISNPEMAYPKAKIEKMPCWIGGHHNYSGGLLEHTLSVTRIVLSLADNFEQIYKAVISRDNLIAGALLHDIMKVFILKQAGKKWDFTGSLLDHAHFTACELYARGFPEEVIHIVASHGGDIGSAGANPRTIEALLVYWADMIDSATESTLHGTTQLQILFMPPEEKENA